MFGGGQQPTFVSLTNLDNWESLEEFFESCDERLLKDVEHNLERRRQLREKLLSDPAFKTRVIQLQPELRDWAWDQLFGGKVCAVDGTLSIVPSTSGGRARIGVVATSYKADKIERVVYVSYRQLAEPVDDPADYFKKLKAVAATSSLFMRAVMAFAERDLALRRQEEWKFVHGELVPYELRTGLGKTRALPHCLNLCPTSRRRSITQKATPSRSPLTSQGGPMPLYCACKDCKKTFGQAKLKKETQQIETHIGPRVRPLKEGELLCHFSRFQNLTQLASNEIHRIQQFQADVCAICFTYHTVEKAPETFKAGVRQSELAGPHRYDIYPDVANQLPLYASNRNWRINGQQVVLVVGCGGYLVFEHQVATDKLVMGSYPNGGKKIAPPPPLT